MKRIKKYLRMLNVFICPSKFVDTFVTKKGICVEELVVVIVLTFIYRYLKLKQVDEYFLIRPILSIVLFAAIQHLIYLIGGGKSKWNLMINLSIYLHFIVVIGSFFTGLPVISILMFLGIQLLGVYYHYVIGKNIIGVNEKFIKIFCGIEIVGTLISVNYQLLTYLGRCVVYSKHTQFFPLIIK